jgi:hypothetical protein
VTDEERETLKALARAADGSSNPGDWWNADALGSDARLAETQFAPDRAFIAAANPEAVLALIEENERLKADNHELRGRCGHLGAETIRLRTALEDYGYHPAPCQAHNYNVPAEGCTCGLYEALRPRS